MRLGIGVVWAACVGQTPGATAQDRLSADVSAGVAIATNPYLQPGPQTSSTSAFFEIAPQYVSEDEVSTLRINGRFRAEPFFRRYSTDASGSLGLNYTEKRSDTLTLRGRADVQSTRSSAQDALFLGATLVDPLARLPQLGDPTFLGQPARATSVSVSAGGTYLLNPREMIDLDVTASAFRFDAGTLANYNYALQEARYSRKLSERTWLIAGVRVGQADFLRTSAGDAFTVTPTVGVQVQLSPTLNVSGGAGYSFARFGRLDGSRDTLGALALQASLCDARENRRLCLSGDRSVQPTAIGGVSTLSTATLAYSNRLNATDDLQLNASYGRNEGGALTTIGNSTFVGATAELSRKLSPRLQAFGAAAYADIFQGGIERRANFQGRIGLRLRVGSLR